MFKLKLNTQVKVKKVLLIIFLLSLNTMFLSFLSDRNKDFKDLSKENKAEVNNDENPNNSALWANLTLTNTIINNTLHYHNETVQIKGRLYHFAHGGSLNGYNVSLYVNGKLYSKFNATTQAPNGNFTINFTIPFNLEVYKPFKIEANVTDNIGGYGVVLQNYFSIYLVPYMNLTLTNTAINNSYQYHNPNESKN